MIKYCEDILRRPVLISIYERLLLIFQGNGEKAGFQQWINVSGKGACGASGPAFSFLWLIRRVRRASVGGFWVLWSGLGGGWCRGYSGGGGFRPLLWVLPSRAVRGGLFRGIGDWRFPDRVGARGLCPKSRARYVRASPSEVFPAGKLQGHFTCGFDYRHSLWFPLEVAFVVLKGLKLKIRARNP